MKTGIQRLKYICLECGLILALLYAFLTSVDGFQPVQAQPDSAIYTVTTTNNGGPGSLRQAIVAANLNPGADDIVFDIPGCTPTAPCVITLQTPLPLITDSVTISGTGAASLIIDANSSMRGLSIDTAVAATIADITIQNGNTTGRGAGIRSFGPLTLIRVRLLQNQAGDDGGGVYGADVLQVIDSYFAYNSSLGAGGGLHTDSWLELENSEFVSNTAVLYGGGASGDDVLLTGGSFIQNFSDYEGGGLFANDTLFLTGTTFLSNTTGDWGGGLSAGDAWIYQAWFEGNRGQYAGGVYTCCSLVVENSTFLNNMAIDGDGGGVVGQSIVLTETSFISNTASQEGGGLYVTFDVQVNQGWFEGNTSEDGGGIYSSDSVDLTGVTFLNNTAVADGGGVNAGGLVHITAGRFEGNESGLDGGGLYGDSGYDVHLEDTLFTGNKAQHGSGGGMYIANPVFTTESGSDLAEGGPIIALTRTQFISNTALEFGGGLVANDPLWLNASTFSGNEANIGGGVYHGTGYGSVLNTLFVHNKANTTGAALALDSPDSVTVLYTTLVSNTGNNAPGIALNTGTLFLLNTIIARHAVGIRNFNGQLDQDYNLFFQNGTNIEGNFNGGDNSFQGNPRFVAPEAGDFHLSIGSAALDAALDVFGIAVDFEDQPRPLGSGFDIGYDEADLISGLAISFSPGPTTTTYIPMTFTATVIGGSGVSYTWDFGDGSPPVSGNPIPHIYTAPGAYSVTVTATNSAGSVSTMTKVAVVPGGAPPGGHRIFLPLITR